MLIVTFFEIDKIDFRVELNYKNKNNLSSKPKSYLFRYVVNIIRKKCIK